MTTPGRVLIVGATGYIGKHIAQASLVAGHPTFLLVRPDVASDVHRVGQLMSLKKSGARFLQGSVHDFSSLVKALKQVDIVISAMAEDRLLDQLKLVEAIKEAGNIKRFLPSEFGMDPDRSSHCPSPTGDVFADKRKVRRAVEAAGIPYTYVSANCFAGYFLAGLAQIQRFLPPTDSVLIYGDGNKKVIWVAEEDVGAYVIKTIEDPRVINTTVYIRPPANILSQNEVVAIWEKQCRQVLQKTHIAEALWLKEMNDTNTHVSRKVVMGFFHLIFYNGELYNFDIGPTCGEASQLYPLFKYKTVEEYLRQFL